MQRREKVNKIRSLMGNPPPPSFDLSKWTDEDLRQVVALQNKTDITAEDQKAFETLLQKYTTHEN